MFNPPILKFKKVIKKKSKPNSKLIFKENFLSYGEFSLKTREAKIISFKQLEAARRVLRRKLKKEGNIWIRVFTGIPITKKSLGTRMGKGKGPVVSWIFPLKKGTPIFELKNVSKAKARKALEACSKKLPFKTIIVEDF
jgi:large subunit ribosomal protein L16